MKIKKHWVLLLLLFAFVDCNKKTADFAKGVYVKGRGYLLLVAPLAVDYIYNKKGEQEAVELIDRIAYHAGKIQDIRRGGSNSVRLGALMDEIGKVYELTVRVNDPRLKQAEKWLGRLSTAVDLIPMNLPSFDLEEETNWLEWAEEQKRLLGVSRPVEIRSLEAQLLAADGGIR